MVAKTKKKVVKKKVVKNKVRPQDRKSNSAGLNKVRKAQAAKRKAAAAKRKAAAAAAAKNTTQKDTGSTKFMESTKKGNFKDRAKKGFGTNKKKPSTLKKLAKVAGRTLKSPVGKAGLLGTAAAAAYYGYKEFAGKKKKPIVKKKVVAKKKVAAKKRKLSPGESKIRKSDIMGGSKGRLSGPSGPLGSKIDKRKKSTVVKNRNTRFDPKKANRAGQRKGQR